MTQPTVIVLKDGGGVHTYMTVSMVLCLPVDVFELWTLEMHLRVCSLCPNGRTTNRPYLTMRMMLMMRHSNFREGQNHVLLENGSIGNS